MNPFFIVGMQRSGTTLLASLLDKHPAIDVGVDAIGFRLVSCFQLYAEVLPYNAASEQNELLDWLIQQDYKGRLAEFFDQAPASSAGSVQSQIEKAIKQQLQKTGKATWGDKVPDMEHFVPQLLMMVPNARFIHVVRNGRAVAQSHHERAHKNRVLAGQQWVDSVALGLHNQAMLGEQRYLIVKYEDLVQQPEVTLQRVCNFLEVGFDRSMLNEQSAQQDSSAYVAAGLDASKISAYKDKLNAAQIKALERYQWPMLERLGYELQAPKPAQYREMSVAKRIRLNQWDNFKSLFIAKRQGMTGRQTTEVKIPLSTRLKHFVFYLGNDFLPKRFFRRVFRKRFIKNPYMKR